MARSTTVDLTAYKWTQLTADDATGITFLNNTGAPIWVQGMASAADPSGDPKVGSIKYGADMGERNASLSDLFPGITAVRVYAWSEKGGPVFVSHD